MITLPDGCRVCVVHDFRSRIGLSDGVNNVCEGLDTGCEGLGVIVRFDRTEDARESDEDPEGARVLESEDKKAGIGDGIGLERPEGRSSGVAVPDFKAVLYSMILRIFRGSLLEVITVVTPAPVAISAAMSFVSIPPVPKLEPRVVVLTGFESR